MLCIDLDTVLQRFFDVFENSRFDSLCYFCCQTIKASMLLKMSSICTTILPDIEFLLDHCELQTKWTKRGGGNRFSKTAPSTLTPDFTTPIHVTFLCHFPPDLLQGVTFLSFWLAYQTLKSLIMILSERLWFQQQPWHYAPETFKMWS